MSLSVLAVDDSRTIRDLLGRALEEAGFAAALARDGLHGLELLEAGRPPDAILTDVNMPRMDGFAFIEAVRARPAFSAVPILVLTTESAEDLGARARSAGASGWIVKPVEPARLIRALRTVAGPGGA
jgi:two-component system chemotaxis response regulator CheY